MVTNALPPTLAPRALKMSRPESDSPNGVVWNFLLIFTGTTIFLLIAVCVTFYSMVYPAVVIG